ncbi:membrane protein [Streptomyces avidinii]
MRRLGRVLGGPVAGQAARTPFVLLVVALLGGGLISLLLLNSALNQGSFQLSKLRKETTTLTDEEQALQRDVDGYSAPDALQRRAQELGLVPGGSPVFIGADGKVAGTASAAAEPPPPSPPAAAPPVAASPGAAVPSPAGAPAPAPSGAAASVPAVPPASAGATQPSQTPGR